MLRQSLLCYSPCNPALYAAAYYWDGNNGIYWNSLGPTNWSLSPNYIDDPLSTLPGIGDDVYFIYNPAYNLSNTLGQDFSVRGITSGLFN